MLRRGGRAGEAQVLAHVAGGEARGEIVAKHTGELEIGDAGTGRIVLEGGDQPLRVDSVGLEQVDSFGQGDRGGGGHDVGGQLDRAGLADLAHGQNGFGAGGEDGTGAFQRGGLATDVVGDLSLRGGVAAAGERSVEKGGAGRGDVGREFAHGLRCHRGVAQDDVAGSEGGDERAHRVVQGLVIGDEDLQDVRITGDTGGVRSWDRKSLETAICAVPNGERKAGRLDPGRDAGTDESEAENPGAQAGRHGRV